MYSEAEETNDFISKRLRQSLPLDKDSTLKGLFYFIPVSSEHDLPSGPKQKSFGMKYRTTVHCFYILLLVTSLLLQVSSHITAMILIILQS